MYGYFFSSPTSNTDSMAIQTNPTASRHSSTAMTRSDSRDSTTSTTSSYTSTGAWDIISSRPSSSSAMAIPFPTQRRTSSSSISSAGWFPSPYRSCLSNAAMEDTGASSYLSDDDLLSLPPPQHSIPATRPHLNRELSTEEQIALLREQADREDLQVPGHGNGHRAEAWWTLQQRPTQQAAYAELKKAKAVRFAPNGGQTAVVMPSGRRRSSNTTSQTVKKRSPTVKRNLVELGQQ